jgi:hypothetical protein
MQRLTQESLFAANVEGIAISTSRTPLATRVQDDDMMVAMSCRRSARCWIYALAEAPFHRHGPSPFNTLLTVLRNPSNPLVLTTAFNAPEIGRF